MDSTRPPDIVIVAGGERQHWNAPGALPRVVAVDAGVEHALAFGWPIDVAVGDFDSLTANIVDRIDSLAGRVVRAPADKDATDLELGLEVALESAPARVLILGIEGGRPDHALANLLTAASPRFRQLQVEVLLAGGRAWVVHDELELHAADGETVTLLPVHGPAIVSASGVRWPLAKETLPPGSSRGVSNVATEVPVLVRVHEGAVLCITPDLEKHP